MSTPKLLISHLGMNAGFVERSRGVLVLVDGAAAATDAARATSAAKKVARSLEGELCGVPYGQRSVRELLEAAFIEANYRLLAAGERGVCVAATALWFLGTEVVIAHVGDCSVFLLRDGSLARKVVEHTLASQLVGAGQLSVGEVDEFDARAVLSRALGVSPDLSVDVATVDVLPFDTWLVANSALVGALSEAVIAAVLLRHEGNPTLGAAALVELASGAGRQPSAIVATVCGEIGPSLSASEAERSSGTTAGRLLS